MKQSELTHFRLQLYTSAFETRMPSLPILERKTHVFNLLNVIIRGRRVIIRIIIPERALREVHFFI